MPGFLCWAIGGGIQIGNVTQNQVRSYVEDGDEMIVEVLSSNGVEQVSGSLPPKAKIAERYRDGSGIWWSYAVLEKTGAKRRIQTQRDRLLGAARLRAVIPGWSQFTKGERGKGMRILVSRGHRPRRARDLCHFAGRFREPSRYSKGVGSRARDDRQWYDDWANRFYWGGMACGVLAGGTYIYSLVDGLTHVPPTYKLLLSKAQVQAGPEGLAVVFRKQISPP